MVDIARRAGPRREEVLTWSEEKPTTAKPNHPLAHSTAWWISQRLGNGEASFRPAQGAEKDGADNQTATRCRAERSLRYRPP
jgi:hypothetical protein